MMMINLYQTPPNMSSIGAVCNSLRKTFPSLLVDNLWATGGLRVNSSPVKVKLIIFPLFLSKGNSILPITPKAVCEGFSPIISKFEVFKIFKISKDLLVWVT